MEKIIFVLKMLFFVLLVVWTVNSYICIFCNHHDGNVDHFSIGFGLLLQLISYFASYLFLFRLLPTMAYIRDSVFSSRSVRILFLLIAWGGSLFALDIVLAGVHAHEQDKLQNAKVSSVIWSQCVFTIKPCYKSL